LNHRANSNQLLNLVKQKWLNHKEHERKE